MNTAATVAALTAAVLTAPTLIPGVRPNRAPGFVDVKADALRPGMKTSGGRTVLSLRRAPAQVWVAGGGFRNSSYVDHPEAVFVTWEDTSYRPGSPHRIQELPLHPDHYVAGVVAR